MFDRYKVLLLWHPFHFAANVLVVDVQAVRVPEAAATHVVHSHGDTDDASALPEDAATTTVVHHHHSVYAYVSCDFISDYYSF